MPKSSRDPVVSIPLPLPVHFALLPARIPGKSLAPLLYSLINDIPVYLTLSPSHQPHFSLLPLLLSLKPPIPPLHILTSLRLTSTDYSLDLNGAAPVVDIWVEWQLARRICEKLGVSRLFWDEGQEQKGLLSEITKGAVSWDEGNTIGHNWMPPTSNLPSSSYSLGALLDTPVPGLAIIPAERCVFTPIDSGRRANIIANAESGDMPGIRLGEWGAAWEGMVRWTILAWEDFLRYPSTPKESRSPSHTSSNLPSTIHDLLPALSRVGRAGASSATFTPSFSDLQALMRPPVPDSTDTESVITQIISTARSIVSVFVPLLHREKASKDFTPDQLKQLQMRARVNLGIVESISIFMMSSWCNEHELKRLEMMEGKAFSAAIVLDCSRGLLSSDGEYSHTSSRPRHKGTNQANGRKSGHKRPHRRGDSLEDLRRRRAGSPPTDVESTPQTSSGSSSSEGTPVSPHRNHKPLSTPSVSTGSRLRRATRESKQSDSTSAGNHCTIGFNETGAVAKTVEAVETGVDVGADVMKGVVLFSESKEGWWMYISVMCSVVVALLMGYIG